MLRITHVRLHNICMYDDFSSDIQPGLTAVCGPNGFGKTSLLRGMAYALTGLVDGAWGSQVTLQKDGTADPGWAEIEFSAGQRLFRLRRFSTSGGKFPDLLLETTNGGMVEVASRRQAVDAALQDMLGIPVSLMFQICWGRQGQLDSLLTASGAVISSFLQSVFDIKRLEKLRALLKGVSDTVAVVPDMAAAIADHEQQLAALGTPPSDDDIWNLESRFQQLTERQSELNRVVRSGISKEDSTKRLAALKKTLASLESSLDDNAEEPEPYNPEVSLSSVDAAMRDMAGAEAEHRTRIGDLSSSLSGVSERIKILEYSLQEAQEERAGMLDKLGCSDERCCLCHGDIADKSEYARLRCSLVSGFSSMDDCMKDRDANIAGIKADLDTCRAGRDRLSGLLASERTGLDSCVAELQGLTGLRDALVKHDNWTRSSDARKHILSQLDSTKQLVSACLDTPIVDDAVLSELAALSAERTAASAELRLARDKRAAIDSDRRFLEQTLATEKDMQNSYEINNEARKTLMQLRDVFSQTGAQTLFLKSKIAEINNKILDYMRFTQLPFTLRLNEESHLFEYVTQEGFTHPAGHLSGAQKSMSSVVLQMAILSVVQPSMNLFLIDEPAEALDDSNKIIMSVLFERMNKLLPSIEGVMLIVSRDPQILAACENEIRVGN